MRHLALFLAASSSAGLAAFAGCSSNVVTSPTGSAGSHAGSAVQSSSSSSGSTASSSSSSSSGTGGGGPGTGGAAAFFECTVPSPPPSHGSCVTFEQGDGGELDAGVDSVGNASITTCNPFTNAGCTGTDICREDSSLKHFYCMPGGSSATVPVCGACTGTAGCEHGELCAGSGPGHVWCGAMCCTDADCGPSGKCTTTVVPTPAGVGVCAPK